MAKNTISVKQHIKKRNRPQRFLFSSLKLKNIFNELFVQNINDFIFKSVEHFKKAQVQNYFINYFVHCHCIHLSTYLTLYISAL